MHSRIATLRLLSTRLNATLAGLVALFALLYAVFLLMAVMHASSRAAAAAGIQELTGRLSTLETRYLALEREITPARAEALGLVKASSAATVFADPQVPSLTLGDAGR